RDPRARRAMRCRRATGRAAGRRPRRARGRLPGRTDRCRDGPTRRRRRAGARRPERGGRTPGHGAPAGRGRRSRGRPRSPVRPVRSGRGRSRRPARRRGTRRGGSRPPVFHDHDGVAEPRHRLATRGGGGAQRVGAHQHPVVPGGIGVEECHVGVGEARAEHATEMLRPGGVGERGDLHEIADRRWRWLWRRVGALGHLRRRREHLDPDARRAGTDYVEHARRRIRQVDGAAADERPAVVDPDLHRATVGEVGDHDACSERQRAMRSRQLVLVVDLSAGGAVAVKAGTVPRGDAELDAVDHRRWRGRPGAHGRAAREQVDDEHRAPPRPPHPRRALWRAPCGRSSFRTGFLRLLDGRLVVTTPQVPMSGHSKWSSIKHKKALKDARRGKLFTKLIKEITVAARLGGGDINANPRLRTAVLTARQNSMPTDNIDRAIKKGTGDLEGVTYDEVTYEGYGPGGVAILVHALTDNRNRTVADVRSLIQKYGGNLGASGSVGWMFQKCGLVTVERRNLDEDRVMEVALEAGADDGRESGDILESVAAAGSFEAGQDAL